MYKKNYIIYLAGILDGEGWFSVQKHIRKNGQSYSYMPVIGVANTNKVLMDWLIDNFGGSIIERQPNIKQFGGKLRYEWRPKWSITKLLLKKIIPFLILKQNQAKILEKIGDTLSVKYRHCGVPKHILDKRELLYLELRKLNNTHHHIYPLLNLIKEK